MASTWLNPTVVARRLIKRIDQACIMGRLVYRGYEEEWAKRPNGFMPGQSVNLGLPLYARTVAGLDISASKVELNRRSTTLSLDYPRSYGHTLTGLEMTYNIDAFDEAILEPIGQAFANYIDSQIFALYKNIPAQVGTPGTTPKDFLTFALAKARLVKEGAPTNNLHCVVDADAEAYVCDHLKNVLNQNITTEAITNGTFGKLAGMTMHTSNNIQNHTCGTHAGVTGTEKNGLSANGDTTVAVNDAASALTLKQGDIFTFADVYGCNPITGAKYSDLRQFCVDADSTFSDLGGANFGDAALQCTPGTAPHAIYDAQASSKFLPYMRMVDAAGTAGRPKANAAMVVAGSASLIHPVNLAFNPDAIGLAMVPLAKLASATWQAQESYNGYTVTLTRYITGDKYEETLRADILFGLKVLDPFQIVRIAG